MEMPTIITLVGDGVTTPRRGRNLKLALFRNHKITRFRARLFHSVRPP